MNQPAELLSQDQRVAVAAEAYELLDPALSGLPSAAELLQSL